MRQGFVQEDNGTITVPLENIWARVKRWAKRHGHEYVASYGIVGVAPI